MKMTKTKFEIELSKIQNQGVVFIERGESSVYMLRVNLKGTFAVSQYKYWGGAVHGRHPIHEWAYDNADDALAKFAEIKALPDARWSANEKLWYAD